MRKGLYNLADKQTKRLISLFIAFAITFVTAFSSEVISAEDVTDVEKIILAEDEPEMRDTSSQNSKIPDSSSCNTKVTDKLTINFGKVGIGDCAILECGGEAAVIDGGFYRYRKQIKNTIDMMGIKEFKFLINTHAHEDHAGGLRYIVKNYEYGDVYVNGLVPDDRHNKKLARAVNRKGGTFKPLYKDDVLTLGSATLTVIGPTVYYPKRNHDDVNNNSLIIMVQHGSKRILFTGDALVQEQNDILNSKVEIGCDVLKVPHHGFKNASNDAFIAAASPTYSICTGPKFTKLVKVVNWQPFAVMSNKGAKVYSTGYQGIITMTSDGENIEWDKEPVVQN